MEDLGVTLVEDSMRVLRRTLRDGRRDLAARQALPTVRTSIDILFNQVREDESAFRFLIREQHGGVTEVRRAIDTERRLFARNWRSTWPGCRICRPGTPKIWKWSPI